MLLNIQFYHIWKPWWKMAAAQSPCGGLKTRVLHFSVKNTLLIDKRWKDKVQKNAQFSFCWGREAFHQEIVLLRNSTQLFTSKLSDNPERVMKFDSWELFCGFLSSLITRLLGRQHTSFFSLDNLFFGRTFFNRLSHHFKISINDRFSAHCSFKK